MTRIVVISDTHNKIFALKPFIPDGDILIHCGDHTGRGSFAEMHRAAVALGSLPHRFKVSCAGNHDHIAARQPQAIHDLFADNGIRYLCNTKTTVEGITIYGSPWTPWFHDWAFNGPRNGSMKFIWDRIPRAGIDILVTHGPPRGILDRTAGGDNVGCPELLEAIGEVRPKYHLFGHIHESFGRIEANGVVHMNCASLNLDYQPGWICQVFDWSGTEL